MAATPAEQLQAKIQAKLNGPAMVPPPGITPNFVNPPNLNHIVVLTLVLCMVFSTLAVVMRMYTKLFIIRKTAFEDYVVILGYVMAVVETVPSGLTTKYGGGAHQWNVQLKNFFRMLYWTNISTIIYNPTLFIIKLSILLQYLRIFVPSRRANMGMFIAVHSVIAAIFIFYLVDMAFNIAICRPREKYWNRLMTTGSCYNLDASMQATGLFNVVSDFTILVLPIRSIWKLQVPMRKKLGILAIFATGFLACVISIVRSYLTFKIVKSHDVSYNLIMMGFWTYAEIAIGIIISCLPVLPRLFQTFGPRIYSAFSFRSKTSGVTQSETQASKFVHTPVKRMGGKNGPGGFVDLYELRTEVSGEYSPLHEHEPKQPGRVVTNDSSRTSLAPSRELPSPMWEGSKGEHQPGQILRTTHIETELEPEGRSTNVSRADLERQQLGW